MNPDQPSRGEIEAKLTALLLGELPDEEARLLRWAIAHDVELAQLHDRLKVTIGLVREVTVKPTETIPLKLSDDRRKKLLAHFKTPRPKPSIWLRPIVSVPRLVTVLALVALVALVAVMFLPALSSAKKRAMNVTMLSGVRGTYGSGETEQSQGEVSSSHALPETVPPDLKFRTWSGDNSGRQELAAAARLATVPTTITVAPEPVLAPPPVQIVLPPAESPSPVTAVSWSLGDSGKAGVPSQNSAGNANVQNHFGLESSAPAVPPGGVATSAGEVEFDKMALSQREQLGRGVDTQQRIKVEEKQRASVSEAVDSSAMANEQPKTGAVAGFVNAFAGASDFRNSGGGGGGATASPPAKIISNGAVDLLGVELPATTLNSPNSTTMAWNGSDANSSLAQNQRGASGRGFSLLGPVAGSEEQRLPGISDFASEDGANVGQLIGAERKREEEKSKNTRRYDGFFVSPSDESVIANNLPVPHSGIALQDQEKNLAKLSDRVSGDLDDKLSISGLSVASNKFYRNPAEPPAGNPVPLAGDVPVLGRMFQNSVASKAALGAAKDEAEVAFLFATTNAVALNNSGFSSGANREDVNRLRFFGSTPAPVASSVTESVTPTLDNQQLTLMNRQMLDDERASKKDQAEVKKNQSYDDAKLALEQKRRMHELLYSKLEAEKLDLGLPKTSMVQITALAEPAKSQTFWEKFTGKVESKARIKVENDVTDIPGMSGAPVASGYDPYFVQTTLEIIQSEAVLGKVVDSLKLDEAWAKNNGDEKLGKKESIALLKKRLDLHPVPDTKLLEIGATSDKPEEAAKIANAVAEAYRDYRLENRRQLTAVGLKTLEEQFAQQEQEIRQTQAEVDRLSRASGNEQADVAIRKPAANAPVPQPEILTRENAFSTFSLNVSDVSFKLAAASLEKGFMPDAASIRSEEFINAFDYRDPEAAAGQPLAFAAERARYPFAHNRDLLRFSVKTAAAGRPAGRALNLVLLLDNSGSMGRADRVQIIREALRVLATQLQPQDTVSVVTFARTARLWADGVAGDKAGETLDQVGGITPQGGTNLEEAMRLAYETARRHYLANGMNCVVLLTDGAANLGNVDAAVLKKKVEAQRKQGIALDCFGIGWEGFNDDLLEQLSSNGDGRYAFINSPEDAGMEFAAKLAGALQVAASDVKVQVEFNPQRVISYRQIGYAKHQLTKEQFRDNTVDAAEIAAQEAGNALYTVETKPDGTGPIAKVRVRYKVPGTADYRERSWDVPYAGNLVSLEQSSAAMRLAVTASAFSEWLAASPFAQEVSPEELLKTMSGVPEIYGADQRPKKLEWMIRQAKSVSGK